MLRKNSSDVEVIKQVFVDDAYDLTRLKRFVSLRDVLQDIRERGKRPLIIDAGANIGAAAMYFSFHYADAVVIAIEPEPANFALLKYNVRGFPIIPLECALGGQSGRVRIVDPGLGHWGIRTEPSHNTYGDIISVTVNEILKSHEMLCEPFIVKIDIEGYEEDVFRFNTEWVDQIPLIIIELHDWLLPHARTSKPFLDVIASRNRDFVHIGENIFSIKNS